MFLAVARHDAPSDVRQRAREYLQIVRYRGREECQRYVYPGALEVVDSARGQHLDIGLQQCVGGRRASASTGRAASQVISLAVDSHGERESIRLARPMSSCRVRETIGRGPDAEVRIVRYERNGGRPQGRQ